MQSTATNRVVHLELHTCELTRARAFYERLLGWRGEQVGGSHGSYLALELGSAVSGGIVQCPTERSLWLPYVEVGDIRRATRDARALGAAVMLEPREGPGGWRSVVSSGFGGELAFWQAKR